MSGFTHDDALAFIESMRLTLVGRVGFRWMVEKLSALADYVDALATENERLEAFIGATGSRAAYEAFHASPGDDDALTPTERMHPGPTGESDTVSEVGPAHSSDPRTT